MARTFFWLLFTVGIAIACTSVRCGKSSEQPAPSAVATPVIIISIDTLRADHLPVYGYRGVQTPHIDALAADGITYVNAWSHVPLTLPSHVSILTGLLPFEHGVRNNLGYRYDTSAHQSITSVLKRNGYESGASVSAYVLRGETGLRDAFDFYDDLIPSRPGLRLGEVSRDSSRTIASADAWISDRSGKPFIFLLHLFDPHAPYQPPEPFKSRYANPYDGEIAASDAAVGSFLSRLKQLGIYDRALIILTSDHGEGLSEHGEPEHGIFLYREAIQVPLIVKLPTRRRAGERVMTAAQLIDIAPTIAAVTRTAWTARRGTSLLDLSRSTTRPVYSESYYGRIHLGWSELQSLVMGTNHFIQAPRVELYDLATDPREIRNKAETDRRIVAAAKQELARFGSAFSSPAGITEEESRKLASLGYLSATAEPIADLPDPKDEIPNLKPILAAQTEAASGRTKAAIATYKKFLETHPRSTFASTELALLLERDDRIEEAIEVYRRALAQSPSLAPNLSLQIGELLLQTGKFAEAGEHAKLAERVNPGAAHRLLANVALRRGDFVTAEREARLSMREGSTRFSSAITLAQSLSSQNRRPEALSLLDQTIRDAEKAGVSIESLHFSRASVLMMLGRPEEAEAALVEEIRLFPGHLKAYGNLATVQKLGGHPADAQKTLEQMVSRYPSPAAYRLAADTEQILGDVAAAAAWRERSARLKTTSPAQ